ncbi:MAG: hypothetical protein IKT22_07000 [Prevotella sp.]|nr:hypothetical protein [Prevotella sp.]
MRERIIPDVVLSLLAAGEPISEQNLNGREAYCQYLRGKVSHVEGIENVQAVRKSGRKVSRREKFLEEFREAVGQAKDFKEGKVEFGTWENLINEL